MKSALRPLIGSILLLGACANLVGITDTEVSDATGGQTSGGQTSGGQTSGGQTNAGSSGKGQTGGMGQAGDGAGGMDTPSAGTSAGGSDGQAGATGAGGEGGGGCNCPPQTPTCDVGGTCIVRGPTMVLVNNFYMDSTEVTIGQYAEFLAAKGDDVSGQPASCAFNTTYAPEDGEITDELALPMTYVDWCDANAFCAWADKRLCGAIGGGPVTEAAATESATGQWFRGCAGPNNDSHPYSPTSNSYEACNDDSGFLMTAGSTCEGSYAGLFDTQSNAYEWIDSCATEDGADDVCLLIGGSYVGVGSGFCSEVIADPVYPRSTRAEPFGFRCCSQ